MYRKSKIRGGGLIHLACLAFVLGLVLTGAARAELVGWWTFDEGSGTIASDSSGNGNDGTLQGDPQWAAGMIGGALDFDGSGDYVDCGNDAVFDITQELTLAVWVNANDMLNGEHNCWLGKGDNAYAIKHQSGNLIEFFIYDGAWNTVTYSTNIDSYNGEWHHMAGTYDGSELKLYIDGDVVATTAYTGSIGTASNNLTIGENSQATGRYFDGLLDDARIYNEALTQEEIQTLMLGGGQANPLASRPQPEDGATYTLAYVNLQWKAGAFAASHDVYLGDNFDDVNDGTGGTFRGSKPLDQPWQIVGFQNQPYPDGLVPGTTYYWRIDEVNDANAASPWKGEVWSFWVPPTKAHMPVPADGGAFVPTDVTLTWTAGVGAAFHHVYFGENAADVAAGTPDTDKGQAPLTSFSPGTLELDKTYYWRVDEFDEDGATHTGDVWSFTTTRPGLGTIVMERWDGFSGTVPDLRNFWRYPNDPDVVETLTEFSWDQDFATYGARIYGWVYVPADGDYTFWLASDDNGELWLSTDEDAENVELIATVPVWVDPSVWETYPEQMSAPITLTGGNRYYVEALWQEGDGGDHCMVAWQGPTIPTRTIIPGSNLSPYLPVKAYGANPANNSTGAKQTGTLRWKPGIHAASHQVYFGTDEDAVRNATTASPEYQGTRALGSEIFEAGGLPWETTRYWRIDEVNNLNPDSPWVGSVWKFTTAGYAIIDNFEDYGGDEAPLQEQIWYSWRDGLGFGSAGVPPYSAGNGTGAEVGDGTTNSYTEETIVHGGRQALPYWYNNNKADKFKYSEAKMTMTDLRDWTLQGVKALSIWFQGNPASTGSFTVAGNTYTMTGSGADIWYASDEFHYAYKQLTGAGTIIAKVESLDGTNASAKAGVMIRETLAADSKYAIVALTPDNGVVFEARFDTAVDSEQPASQAGLTAPYWVKLERDLAGDFTASYSADGSAWQVLGTPENIQMNSAVYIGLPVTSHDAALTCEAVFSSVEISGNVGGQWMHQDIGIISNDAEPMYVAIANNTGQPAVVYHDDAAATQIDTWTQWNIDLKDFQDQGINLADVNSIAIGFGDRNNPQAGGWGKMYFDDIRLYRPRIVPGKGTPIAADFNGDAIVDFGDLEIMADDWLLTDVAEPVWDGAFASQDIGATTAAGNYNFDGATYTIQADGNDIWGNADAFHYAQRQVSGDFQMTVRVTGVDAVDGWTKAGIMARSSLDPGAANAFMAITGGSGDGATFQWREAQDGSSDSSRILTGISPPSSIRLVRSGDTFTGYVFLDGRWQQEGTSIAVVMADPIRLGLAVTSHVDGTLTTATFDRLTAFSAADLNDDETVNFEDYALLLEQWLEEQLWPEW